MKTNNKLLAALLVFAMLTCTFFVSIPTFAEDATELAESELAIDKANVAYNEMNQLAFTLEGTPAEGKEAGIAVWKSTVTGEKTLENASFINFEFGVLEGVTYWLTQGIAANEMSVKLTVAPCVRDIENPANVAIAGDFFEYSIYDYVKDRLSDDNVTDVQMKLYYNLVKYGNQAEKVVNGSINIPYVAANNGEINNTGKSLALPTAGDTLTLRANTLNADGDYFLYWTAPDGTKIYDRVTSVTATAANAAYTANYGAKADSAYAGSEDLNALSVGEYNLVTNNAIQTYGGNVYYTTGETSHFGGLVVAKGHTKVTSADDRTPLITDLLEVREKNGAKSIHFEKKFIQSGLTGSRVVLKNLGANGENRIDIDFSYNNAGWIGFDWHVYGSGGKETHPGATFDSSGNFAIYGVAAGNFKRGEKINLVIDLTENGLEFYVNGNYVTTKSLSWGTDCYFTGFGMTANSGCGFDVDFYSVNFVDTDKFN